MAKGQHAQAGEGKRTGTKLFVLVMVLVLALGSVVGGTVAWLISAPDPVVNTFTYGDINITLTETDTDLDDDNDPNTNRYEMLPGEDIEKDPVVTVKQGSEANWLFVKLEKSDNFDTFMEFEMAQDDEGNAIWTALDNTDGVYFRAVTEEELATADVDFQILKDNTVTVKEEVTKEQLNALDPEGQTPDYPQLTVTAYAVQYVGMEPEVSEGATAPTDAQVQAAAALAWAKAVSQSTTTP